MGMDLIPRSDEAGDGLHFNWTGWGVMLNLLDACGANLRAAAGSNDGAYVPAKDAEQWGLALLAHLERIVVVETPSALYSGGYHESFGVTDRPIDETVCAEVRAQLAERGVEGGRVRAPSRAEMEWLTSSALFFLRSRGFRQY